MDLHLPSLEVARERGHIAIACNLESEVPKIVADCDVVMFLDVLEHLTDPSKLLREVVEQLRCDATIIVSLPNVRYWEVSFNLVLFGRWQLQDSGVLDRTHLRFFTRKSGADLMQQAGLNLQAIKGKLPGARRYALLNTVTMGLLRDFLCSQYLFVGTKV